MFSVRKQSVSLYVDQSTRQLIVRDQEGQFWILPDCEEAWDNRQPFELSDDSSLEPMPGHYKHMFGIPL